MTELNPQIKNALVKIDFVKRYEELSSNFSKEKTPPNKRLVYIDGEEVMDMLHNLGYVPLFDKKEKFYKIKEEQLGKFIFGVHIILQDGAVDLVWIVKENNQLLLGAPWSTYSRRLINVSYRIAKPVFGAYEELESILKVSFRMYEEFKKRINFRLSKIAVGVNRFLKIVFFHRLLN